MGVMRTDEAIRQLRGMVFKPGWEISATRWIGDDMVLVELVIDTVDTSYPDYDGICRRRVRLARETFIRPSQIDSTEALCYEVLRLAADTDQHENREFLKVRDPVTGRWESPLHPHTEQGNDAWDRYNRGRVAA